MSKSRRKKSVWTPESGNDGVAWQIEISSPHHQAILKGFADWLLEERGMSAGTVKQRVAAVAIFLDGIAVESSRPVEERLSQISVKDIEVFFVEYGENHSVAMRRVMRSGMRRFLQFAASRGWVAPGLAETVPGMVGWRQTKLPRMLSNEELVILLTTEWSSGECPGRDRAVLELLVTYGVRCQQVSALKSDDLRWRERTVHFAAHKGGKAVHHELTPRVADFLAEYLRSERVQSDCPYVFLRSRPPHKRISPAVVSNIVKARMRRCGLPPLHAHALRHTFASRLLRTGQSMKTIADLLGHRSLSSVANYAKVDVDRLLGVAMEWPEVVS